MPFGFGDGGPSSPEKKKISFSTKDVLRWNRWDDLKKGRRVQSVLTGTEGVITSVNDKFESVEIHWDNGKTSKAYHRELVNVIFAKSERKD